MIKILIFFLLIFPSTSHAVSRVDFIPSSPSQLTDLSDVNSATTTSGDLLIADGSAWNSVAMTGDCTITDGGVTSCAGGASQLTDLTDVNSSTVTSGNFLMADGTAFHSVTLTDDVTSIWNGNVSVIDMTCTDCINATEIEDIYLLNTGDTATGDYDFGTGLFWDGTNNRLSIAQDNQSMTLQGLNVDNVLTIHIEDGDSQESEYSSFRHSATAGLSSLYYGARSRGTFGSETIVQSGDVLLGIYALGHDGTDYNLSSGLAFDVDATPGPNDMPGRIRFLTATDGTNILSESFRIDDSQQLIIATGKNLLIGSTQWNSGDSIDGTKVANADLGDISVSSGSWTIDANAVALGTDTTGNYVATITDAGNSTVTVTGSGSETAEVTLDVAFVNSTTANPGNLLISDSLAFHSVSMGGDVTIDQLGSTSLASDSVTTDEINFINSATSTSGNLLIANGTDFDSVTVSGDVTIDNAGVTSLSNDSVSTDEITFINSSTNTSGNLLISDSIAFHSISMGGDVTITQSGTTSLSTDSVTTDEISFINSSTATSGDLLVGDGTGFNSVGLGSGIVINTSSLPQVGYKFVMRPHQAKLPTSNFAPWSAANNRWRGLFDDGTEECVHWEDILYPYSGGALQASIYYTLETTQTSKITSFDLYIECKTDGDATFDTDSFGTADSISSDLQSLTAGTLDVLTDTSLNGDSCTENDHITIKLCRDVVTDTVVDDVELRKVLIFE